MTWRIGHERGLGSFRNYSEFKFCTEWCHVIIKSTLSSQGAEWFACKIKCDSDTGETTQVHDADKVVMNEHEVSDVMESNWETRGPRNFSFHQRLRWKCTQYLWETVVLDILRSNSMNVQHNVPLITFKITNNNRYVNWILMNFTFQNFYVYIKSPLIGLFIYPPLRKVHQNHAFT